MREKIRGIFASLPPEGIAIHGTSTSRARAIKNEGFNRPDGTWFLLQPPRVPSLGTLHSLTWAIHTAAYYGMGKAIEENPVSMSLILFLPPKEISFLSDSPGVLEAHSYSPIPKKSIIETITLGGSIPYYTAEYRNYWNGQLRNVVNILREKGIIDSGEPPLPQQG